MQGLGTSYRGSGARLGPGDTGLKQSVCHLRVLGVRDSTSKEKEEEEEEGEEKRGEDTAVSGDPKNWGGTS